MVVQHNLRAMNSNRMLGLTTSSQTKSTEKLSSGYKINRAADDAAGLSISEKMRKQMRGLTQAAANAQDGISAVQTAEGALTEVHDMLQRMNELAVKASNGSNSESDRSYIQNEIDQLVTEIDRVSETTKFNETYLLKGSGDKSASVKAEATIGGANDTTKTTQKANIIEAKGNIAKTAITSTLATGTEDTAKITYKDADGNTRTKEVTFKVGNGSDADTINKETAANLAAAISADDDLGKIFNASTDGNKLVVESKLNGNKTDNKKNVFDAIEFKSKGATLLTTAGALTKVDAVGETAQFKLSADFTTLIAKSTEDQDITAPKLALATGNSITIDGNTYTYEADTTTADTNSFKTLGDLMALLGDDYEVSVTYSQEISKVDYDSQGLPKLSTLTTETESGKLKSESINKALGTIGKDDFDGTFTPKVVKSAANGSGLVYKAEDCKFSLNIARKSNVEVTDALNLDLQVGADATEDNKISVSIESMSAKGLGIDGLKVDGADSKNADNAIETIANAIQKVSTQRSALGAVQNRLEHTISNLNNVVENTTSAESAIRDTDMATEMVKFSNNNILAQAGQSMLAQANQANQGVLSLLG